ncbi:MAG: sulfatase [Acidobacteria bacterium]|nr:sulfatase [Acidobacteriota bacterium]
MVGSLRRTAIAVLLVAGGAGHRAPPVHAAGGPFQAYRFDDQFPASATVSAANAPSSARLGEPLVWRDFKSQAETTWRLLRGRMGFRQGDLIVKGEGSSPVLLSPKEADIDWGQYEALRIRMLAEGGQEIKIKIGDLELKQPLAPPREYQVYRFELNMEAPRGSRPVAIMPTDSLTDLVAISFIELVPRKTDFQQPAGRRNLGKQDEYRNTLYVHSLSSVAFEVLVPAGGRLHVGLGLAEKDKPVTFRIRAGASVLFSRTVNSADLWEDAAVDLSSFAGRRIKLAFETQSAHPGAVGLWANPLLTTRLEKNRFNVLIYMIDTLRADHTSLYGYARDTTPFLKKLGDRGVVFDDCHAQATWTKASTASLFTSVYSFTHGIINDYDLIPRGAATLAEQLRAAGYVTASMVANPFAGKTTGLQRGFDYMMEFPVVHRFRTEAADRGTDSAALNQALAGWLEKHRDEPFFLYAHATDPHAPYRPPAGFEEKFANPAETAEFDRDYARLRDKRQYGGGTVVSRANCAQSGIDAGRFIQRAIDRYDGEILHNDRSLELLVDKLRQLGVLDNTLIVVVSDHGEEFWEHGWTAHGHSLYQELTHTLFLMWNPKLLPSPRRVTEPVQLIDVMPTVLDLLEVKAPALVQGQSLAALARGGPFRRRGPVMTSRFAHPGARPSGFVPENRTGTFALLDANWKLIYRDKAKEAGIEEVELYDRRTDRRDSKNLAASQPAVATRMRGEIGRWIEAQRKVSQLLGPSGKTSLDPKTVEQLRSLGYLGGKQ